MIAGLINILIFSFLFALFNDEPEAFLPKHYQIAILHVAHFKRGVHRNVFISRKTWFLLFHLVFPIFILVPRNDPLYVKQDLCPSIFTFSGENVKTTQKFVEETTRSVIFTKTGDDEYTAEVHRIEDMLSIHHEDAQNIHDLYINVGFPITTSYHGLPDDKPPDEWQDTIRKILHKWRPKRHLFLSCGKANVLRSIMSGYDIKQLRSSISFDVLHQKNGSIDFIKM